ncbi:MAG TPA: hypothetical protein VGK99_24365 [Acidobacteriota bacterium]|jgi:hypothetical protein
MKRNVLVFASLILCLGLAALAADAVNFTGTWALDKSKSDPIRMGRPDAQPMDIDITLTINHTGNDFAVARKISMGGQDRNLDLKYTLDEQENTNPSAFGRPGSGTAKSKAKLDNNQVVIRATQKIETPNGDTREISSTEVYSLSDDGRVLTITTTRTTPNGDRTSKQVFGKK